MAKQMDYFISLFSRDINFQIRPCQNGDKNENFDIREAAKNTSRGGVVN